jgi:hypothetical protein
VHIFVRRVEDRPEEVQLPSFLLFLIRNYTDTDPSGDQILDGSQPAVCAGPCMCNQQP